jgi:Cu/Ag efflux pump CusA
MTEHDIREATISGALLRLRPKQMTLSVVMAALIRFSAARASAPTS